MTHDMQSVELGVPFDKAFDYIADLRHLPDWAHAFQGVHGGRARLETPNGAVEIGLTVHTSREQGTVDWTMTLPDSSVARAFSRVTPAGQDRCIYSFVLLVPPVPLEQLEGTLQQQSTTLREELARLRHILEHGRHACGQRSFALHRSASDASVIENSEKGEL